LSRPEVGEVHSKSLLRRMDFGRRRVEYTINLYRGCTHACVYCYAPSLVHDERSWGTFVDAKVDAPAILRRELRDAERAPVFLSSASDPYQPVEARYKLTRRCLQELHAFGFPVVVLTRSPLVLRDLDILARMEWVRVGCSISTAASREFEPGVPPLERRLETLRRLAAEGIQTWVSLAPVIPGLMTFEIDALLSKLRDARVGAVAAGLLRFQGYEASREMFEAATGMSAEEALESGQDVIARVRDAVEKAGFKSPDELFDWAPPSTPSLDQFVSAIPASP
jgi:DNA repair photolyase